MNTDALVGAWKLISFAYRDAEGNEILPMGPDAEGYIIYTTNGFMSASIMAGGRPKFASADRFAASDAERLRAADATLFYCGRYRVEGDQVIHEVEVASFPNWCGGELKRTVEWRDDGGLNLSAGPIMIDGKPHRADIRWRRA